MRFGLTEEQTALRDAVRELLAAQSTVDKQWAGLAAMGLFGTVIPESLGGLGLTDTDLAPLLIQVGYAAVPAPVAETAAVAAPLLAAAGDPGDVLAGVLAGTTRIALAGPTGIVPHGRSADLALVLDGDGAWLAPPGTARLSTMDTSRAATRLTGSGRVALTTDAGLVGWAADRALVATAAQLVGLARRMLDLTVGYVTTRRQFGVPVGSFQAVKHRLADALLRLEFAEPAVLAAAWTLATAGPPGRDRAVPAAAILATEAAREVAAAAIQCHGAIGYTVEYELHRYAKRTWALASTVDLDAQLARLGAALGVTTPGFTT